MKGQQAAGPVGRKWIGFGLALATTVLWGVMPVALKLLLRDIDPVTLTAVRFLTATLMLGLASAAWRNPSVYWHQLRSRPRLHAIALAGLISNFVLYLIALRSLSPVGSQILIQLGPLFLIAGGIIVLHETVSRAQAVGVLVTIVGMSLFFNRAWLEASADSKLGLSHLLGMAAAAGWAVFGLAQQRLSSTSAPAGSLLLFYAASGLVLLPASRPEFLLSLTPAMLGLIVFASLNTVLAYGALAHALRYLDTARVGAIISTMPLVTAVTEWGCAQVAPELLAPEPLNSLALCGMLLVVVGAAFCALGGRRAPQLEFKPA